MATSCGRGWSDDSAGFSPVSYPQDAPKKSSAALDIENFGAHLPLHRGLFDQFSDWLFLLMAVLFAVKVLFRRDGELFLGGVELLSLGLAVFAGVVVSNLNPDSEMLTVLFKGMLLIMVLKVLIGYRPAYRRVAFAATLAALLVGMLQGVV